MSVVVRLGPSTSNLMHHPSDILPSKFVTNAGNCNGVCHNSDWLLDSTDLKYLKKNMKNRRRASLDVVKEQDNVEEAVKWSALRRRRTSLPIILAGSKKKTTMSSILIDTSTLVEIHFAVDELTKNPSKVLELANKIKSLLKPYDKFVWVPKNSDGSDEEPQRVGYRHAPSKRNSSRRFDAQGGLFSTTTTATGLPKEEPGPVKSKRLPKISKDKSTPLHTPIDSRCSSPVSEGPGPQHMGRRCTYPNIMPFQSSKLSNSFPHQVVHKKISAISSDYESDDPTPMAISSPVSLSRSVSATGHRTPSYNTPVSTPPCPSVLSPDFFPPRNVITPPPDVDDPLREDEVCFSSRRGSEQIDEGQTYFQNYQSHLLESVYNWNFPIFELAAKTDCVLSQMAFKLFQNTGLFETFQIPKDKFTRFMMALENGYREIPYHNKIHAADVLHGCWFLSTQEIPGFHDRSNFFISDSSDSDSGTSTLNTRQVTNFVHGSLAQAIPALELLSLYLAAAMHDYDHPGKTNAFLVETRHPLATFYNDRSVLENHHASASWQLLYSNENFNFLDKLDTAEWKRLRFLIIEAILATDLKKHFDILEQFSNKSERPLSRSVSIEDGSPGNNRRNGINWSAGEDRLLVCQMVIKLADIGGPAKLKPLHITWTKAICEEFFIQGDEERLLNVPVSPFMDRSKPKVAELQRTFINNLITPIVLSMHKAGILAGEIPEDHELYCDADQNLLVEQLKSNLNFWKIETPYTGHDEMKEAFKFALPQRFSAIQPNFSSDKTDRDTPQSNSSDYTPDNRCDPTHSLVKPDEDLFDSTGRS